jgi:7-cyano-7-deazaguanine synthase
MKNRVVVLLSGGMDSLVCAGIAIEEKSEVYFLHVNYGQITSNKEQESFTKICDYYQVPHSRRKIMNGTFLQQIGGSSLTDKNLEVQDHIQLDKSIPNTYVPFRNSIILSLAVSWAEVLEANKLFIGANFEDSPGYPDCRPSYYQAFNQVIKEGTKDGTIHIETPVIKLKKSEIVEIGQRLKVPFELSWSCYKSEGKACGKCDSCALRLRGFQQANLTDPLEYEVRG